MADLYIGALWDKPEGKKGNYKTGVITLTEKLKEVLEDLEQGGKVSIIVFEKKDKTAHTQPDWNILLSRKYDQEQEAPPF